MKLVILISLIVVALTGCTGLTGVIKQLKNDPAVVKMDIVTLYGTGKFVRVGNNTNTVSIAPDGTVSINPK